MFQTPCGQLPPLALAFAKYLCVKYGGCGEVFLTAYSAYAQEVEGLVCTDDLYKADEEASQWFAENKNKAWRFATRADGKITPVCESCLYCKGDHDLQDCPKVKENTAFWIGQVAYRIQRFFRGIDS